MIMQKKILGKILKIPRIFKRAFVISIDVSLVMFTLWLSLTIRLEGIYDANSELFLKIGVISSLLYVLTNISFGLYRIIFRYSGTVTIISHVKAWLVYFIIFAIILIFNPLSGIPRSIGILQPILLIIFVICSRLLARSMLLASSNESSCSSEEKQRVIIYGAGSAGRQLALTLKSEESIKCFGLIDDDLTLQGNFINGLQVYSFENIGSLINKFEITDIFLAMPSSSRFAKNEIIKKLAPFSLKVRTMPGMSELATGKVSINDIRELDLDDVLGREPVPPNQVLLNNCIRGKRVLITGAGGSIGSELCRQVVQCDPQQIILLEHSEFALYSIEKELLVMGNRLNIVSLLLDIKDEIALSRVFQKYTPDTVFHTAAYKHVPIVEKNPIQGLINNVFGTYNVLQESISASAERFILVSSDKAVRPTNIMGASKRMAELVVQAYATEKSNTICSMVRFGNVIGSSGSVVPLFRNQIKKGGPITLTDKEITRFFMSISEAAQLVIQAGAMAKGGEVFLLDMGEPVKIYDLAVRMINLSGLTLKDENSEEGDIAIKITGMRPGEKLYEELLIDDNAATTIHERIMRANENFLHSSQIEKMLSEIRQISTEDHSYIDAKIKQLLSVYVEGYTPDNTQTTERSK